MSGPVVSPGGWRVPPGRRPGWDWTPPGGATARPDRMPRTVRLLYWTPFLDRYAYQLMWWRGGWDVDPPAELDSAVAAALVRSAPDRRERIEVEVPGWFTRAAAYRLRSTARGSEILLSAGTGRRPTTWSSSSSAPIGGPPVPIRGGHSLPMPVPFAIVRVLGRFRRGALPA